MYIVSFLSFLVFISPSIPFPPPLPSLPSSINPPPPLSLHPSFLSNLGSMHFSYFTPSYNLNIFKISIYIDNVLNLFYLKIVQSMFEFVKRRYIVVTRFITRKFRGFCNRFGHPVQGVVAGPLATNWNRSNCSCFVLLLYSSHNWIPM